MNWYQCFIGRTCLSAYPVPSQINLHVSTHTWHELQRIYYMEQRREEETSQKWKMRPVWIMSAQSKRRFWTNAAQPCSRIVSLFAHIFWIAKDISVISGPLQRPTRDDKTSGGKLHWGTSKYQNIARRFWHAFAWAQLDVQETKCWIGTRIYKRSSSDKSALGCCMAGHLGPMLYSSD